MESIVFVVVMYFMFNVLVLSFFMANKNVFGKFYPKGFRMKHLMIIIFFPIAAITAKLLDTAKYYIKKLIDSDNIIKNFLNKPLFKDKK